MTADTAALPVDESTAERPEPRHWWSGPQRRWSGPRRWWLRVPPYWRFVLGLFLGAKLVVTAAALLALHAFDAIMPQLPAPTRAAFASIHSGISPHRILSMWFPFDGVHYVYLVKLPTFGGMVTGRPWNVEEFCFAPLYPWLGKLVLPLAGGNAALAMWLVSQAAFLLTLYYGYRLGERLSGDEQEARRFTRYLVLMPTAFIFQAALTESLFLCLVLACFYYAEKRRWLLVGVLGFFAALTRSIGFLLVIPLALLYLQQGGYRAGRYLWKGWPLALVPGGWAAFLAYSKWRTGDWLRYQHLQESRWAITLSNPLRLIWHGVVHGGLTEDTVRLWIALAYLAVMVVGLRYLKPAYVVYGVLFILMPLSVGPLAAYRSLLRYLLVVFPLAMLCARWSRRPAIDPYLTAILALVQGALLVTWANDWTGFIV
jgi:hypothetical protein